PRYRRDTPVSKNSMPPFPLLYIDATRCPGKRVFWLGSALCNTVDAEDRGPRLCPISISARTRRSEGSACSHVMPPGTGRTFRESRFLLRYKDEAGAGQSSLGFHQLRDIQRPDVAPKLPQQVGGLWKTFRHQDRIPDE